MKVELNETTLKDNTCSMGDDRWLVTTIIDAAKDCEVYDLQLCALDLDVMPWGNQSILSYCNHIKRVESVDINHPIIQAPCGWIIDGWHRVVKAILNGDEIIKAKRLKHLPIPDAN